MFIVQASFMLILWIIHFTGSLGLDIYSIMNSSVKPDGEGSAPILVVGFMKFRKISIKIF